MVLSTHQQVTWFWVEKCCCNTWTCPLESIVSQVKTQQSQKPFQDYFTNPNDVLFQSVCINICYFSSVIGSLTSDDSRMSTSSGHPADLLRLQSAVCTPRLGLIFRVSLSELPVTVGSLWSEIKIFAYWALFCVIISVCLFHLYLGKCESRVLKDWTLSLLASV